MLETIRIFIGSEPKTTIACQVLEFSIRRRCTSPVEITPMIGPQWEYSIQGIKVGTGFSLRRWMIPEACGWRGKAIYLDADQLVLDDISELWNKDKTKPLEGPLDPAIWCSWQPDKYNREMWPQTSVMLINCARTLTVDINWGFDIRRVLDYLRKHADKKSYVDFTHATWMMGAVARIGDEWNHLNKFVPRGAPKHTRLLHYTKEDSQVWYKPKHPLAGVWQTELRDAIAAGAVNKSDFTAALAKWGVKEDWRNTNGLHPSYSSYLSYFPE